MPDLHYNKYRGAGLKKFNMLNSLEAEPIARSKDHDPISFNEAFVSYEDAQAFLNDNGRLRAMLLKRPFRQLLSEEQRTEFISSNLMNEQSEKFLHFLSINGTPALLSAVICYFGSDPNGRTVLQSGKRVKTILNDNIGKTFEKNDLASKGRYIENDNINCTSSPPTPIKPPNSPDPDRTSMGPILIKPSKTHNIIEDLDIDIPDFPKQPLHSQRPSTPEKPFPFEMIRDLEVGCARVILTRTHTSYREFSTRCFVAFNVVFQPNQNRIKRAEISMNFLPISDIEQPIILNMFPNSSQRWPTGPAFDLISNKKNNINLVVGSAHPLEATVGASLGLEKSKEVRSASNSTLTAAGFATPKLTIVLRESEAGDGIIYSFSFGLILDLKTTKKPTFEADLKLHWKSGGIKMPWTKPFMNERINFGGTIK
ncbi:hypothetical protein BY996DRAFT_6432000 [Phakopsora pachyrhizi]|uniref:Uncharacterized protein n=1 Tax=Phakopsora pachyrhizi TaxID=170000 RepID=A0AAV0BRU8_PHAPC|nr:hypothetical protein BY996DRAFT_6432000 [Phakopsora pachyrhizi]CAH7689475.1 hypothetical protein PPACK8108_LOCUS24560 [Phakopsora pachyrhizi]